MQRGSEEVTTLTADQRRREVAGILAAGILRLRSRAALLVQTALEKPENSAPNCLEVPDETRLSGHTG
jgi:hypothetical protein